MGENTKTFQDILQGQYRSAETASLTNHVTLIILTNKYEVH
jgi:hypothetical protein